MFPTGHIASTLLASRRWTLDSRIAIAATLFPDIVDKSARHLFHMVPFGRIPSHTLLALALTTAAVFLLDRRLRRRGRWVAAWLAGYVAHLALDFADLVPLLWPFRAYRWPERTLASPFHPGPLGIASFVLELALIAAAIYVEVRCRRRAGLPIWSRC